MFVFKFMECYFPAQNGDNSDNSDDSDNKNGAMAATAGSDSSDDSDDNDNKNGTLPPAAIKKTPAIGGEIPPTAGVHII